MLQKLLRVILTSLVVFAGVVFPALADPASPFTIVDEDSPDPVASGAQIVYTITMVNTGGARIDEVVMTDQLNGVGGIGVPPQLQITSSRGSCTQTTTLVTCSAGTIEGGGQWVVSVRGVVTASAGTVINNTATITGTKSAQTFTSQTTTTTLVVPGGSSPLPDLSISKNGPTSVVVSSPMIYTLTVNNTGTANTSDVKVVDTLPAGLTGITANGTSLFSCGVSGQTVTCTGGAVNQGSNATITIHATAPATTGTITNTASVDPDNAIAEANELNNTSSLVNTLVTSSGPAPQLSLNITDDPTELADAGPDPVNPGGFLTFKILVTNTTTQRADDVVIVVGTQGLVASNIQVNQVITDGTLGVTGGCAVNAPQVRCSARTLNGGGTILMTITGSVIDTAGSSIITTATVNWNIKNKGYTNTDQELTTVKPYIDLNVTNSATPDPVCARSWPDPGHVAPPESVCLGGLTYTWVIGNSGVGEASNVALRDPLPAGSVFDSVILPVQLVPPVCSVDTSNVLTCTGIVVPPESTVTVQAILVAPAGVGTIVNTVYVDPNNAIFEADETNNTATTSSLVSTGIDLVTAKTDAFDPIATSGTQIYTITVDNLGPQDATNIRIRDTLPAGTIFRDAIPDHGFTCVYSAGIVECSGGAVHGTAAQFYPGLGGPGVKDTATIIIRVFAQPIEGTMHNEVRVDPLNEIVEINEANNIATQGTVVGSGGVIISAFNQFTITKTQTFPPPADNPVARNAKVTYQIFVGNDGTDPAFGITVRDFLPAGSRYIEATGTNSFLCSQVGNYINCAGGQIPGHALGDPVATATITISMFAPDTPGSYTNQAIVDPDNTIVEGNEFDNQSSVVTPVADGGSHPFNDLTIVKTANSATVSPGGTITYTLVVSNLGSDPAQNVAVRDVLPAGETFVAAGDTGAGAAFTCNHSNQVVNCTGATIGGAPRTITISAKAPQALGILHNEAVVDPDNTIPEGNESNNTWWVDVTVTSKINLKVTKSGPTSASQSNVTDYTIVVTNDEPGGAGTGELAVGVELVDPLPVGMIPLAIDLGSGNNWACSVDQNPINLVHCIGDLAPGDANKVTIKITVFITAENGRVLDNVACVDPDNTIVESNELDNCSDVGTFITPAPPAMPDLLVSKNVDSLATSPGASLQYTINISNVGDAKAKGWDGASGATVTDTLPSEVHFVNFSTTNGWTCTEASGTVTCHDDGTGMDPGESAEITILVTVDTGADSPITNTGHADPGIAVDCSGPCDNESGVKLNNNDSTITSSIGSTGIDLAIGAITDVPDPVGPGQGLTYTITATNGGTAPADPVAIEVHYPLVGLDINGADGSNGFNCTTPSGGLFTCTGPLPAGGTTIITVTFTTHLTGLPPDVTLSAKIDPAGVYPESNEGNNEKSQTTTMSTSTCSICVDLVSSELHNDVEPMASGSTATITYQVVNTGDTTTTLNPASDPLLWLYAATDGTIGAATITSSDPVQFPCSIIASGTAFSLGQCQGNLAPGQGVTITMTVPAATGSALDLIGFADPSGLVTEPNEANNFLEQTVVLY